MSRRSRDRYAEEKKDRARAREAFAQHKMKERVSRSFDCRRDDTSNYAFSLTWTPGSLALAGDVGELTLVHYSALWDLEGGLAWATSSDIGYLLSKSQRRQSYDQDGTVEDIIDAANEGAIESLRGLQEEMREWRADKPTRENVLELFDGRTTDFETDFEWEMKSWQENRPALEKIEFDFSRGRHLASLKSLSDGWALWARLWLELDGYGDPNEVFKASVRARLRDELSGHVETQESAAELCHRIGFDDYYGTTSWTYRDITQIEAIRFGAARALEIVRAENWPKRHRFWPAIRKPISFRKRG